MRNRSRIRQENEPAPRSSKLGVGRWTEASQGPKQLLFAVVSYQDNSTVGKNELAALHIDCERRERPDRQAVVRQDRALFQRDRPLNSSFFQSQDGRICFSRPDEARASLLILKFGLPNSLKAP
jgi:hypothetical protein